MDISQLKTPAAAAAYINTSLSTFLRKVKDEGITPIRPFGSKMALYQVHDLDRLKTKLQTTTQTQ